MYMAFLNLFAIIITVPVPVHSRDREYYAVPVFEINFHSRTHGEQMTENYLLVDESRKYSFVFDVFFLSRTHKEQFTEILVLLEESRIFCTTGI
jgi:hypothetical protein